VREHLVEVDGIPARPQVAGVSRAMNTPFSMPKKAVLPALDVDLDPVAVRSHR